MILKNLTLKNFRNYQSQKISFGSRLNYITGNNGEGKTNILEAISLLTFGKSFLNSGEQDCIRFEETEFFVEASFESSFNNEFIISLNYDAEGKKKCFLLNKEKVSSFSADIFGKFPVVFLTPHSLNITYGNPSERRKFFDIIISETSGLYLNYLKELNKIVRQKNVLLKENINRMLLDSYNEKLIEISIEIYLKRFVFLNEFRQYLEKNFSFLINSTDKPCIDYSSSVSGELKSNEAFITDKQKIADDFIQKLRSIYNDEIARGVSLIGPHRDDYLFRQVKPTESEKYFSLKNFASQGEHKTFLIALKLAEFDYISEKVSFPPMLLLDDILSELDDTRVSKIISHLKDFGQIFITSADKVESQKSKVDSLRNYYETKDINIYEVKENRIEHCK